MRAFGFVSGEECYNIKIDKYLSNNFCYIIYERVKYFSEKTGTYDWS